MPGESIRRGPLMQRLANLEALASNLTLKDQITLMEQKIAYLEKRMNESQVSLNSLISDSIKSAYVTEPQSACLYGLQLALCVSTIDPLIQNRVRFFHPGLHHPDIPMKALPFADPISAGFPSFDDSGITWVPPAGTALALTFQNGNVESPFYFGSIWNRNRGTPPGFGCPVPEWSIWAGTRTGYLIGADDETQVFPPWNTWNYNNYDIDSVVDFENDPEAKKRITYPHIYGYKTPEKAYVRHNDGDRKCNLRWKHTEISSSRGNFIHLKDDHLHPAGQWAHPKCGCGGGDASDCMNEQPNCCKCGSENCPGGPTCPGDPAGGAKCANQYFKRQDECRPYKGPNTPLNPKCRLPQSGIHIQSLSGHHMAFDDSVDEPTGKPTWDLEFSFGCTDKFYGKCWWQSATGHYILINDNEDEPQNRSDKNLIRIQTATGNFLELNDHTINKQLAGEKRGIMMMSTSTHMLHMCDQDNEQVSPPRKDGGVPTNKAKNAFIMLRSGYGHHLYMNDFHDQEKADKQFLQVMAPQIGNDERGPHFMHMQVVPSGPGTVLLRAGGVLWLSSYDSSVETVGEGKHQADKFIDVVGKFITNCDDIYFNLNKLTVFKADEIIILAAGGDGGAPSSSSEAGAMASNALDVAKGGGGGRNKHSGQPNIYPIILAKKPWSCPFTKWIHFDVPAMSDKVFAS